MKRGLFKKRLKERRKAVGMTQQQLADRMGVILKTEQNWEQGIVSPSLTTVIQLCDILDCSIDYLVGRIDQRTIEINDIHEKTGLSEEAIHNLLRRKEHARQLAEESSRAVNDLKRQAESIHSVEDDFRGFLDSRADAHQAMQDVSLTTAHELIVSAMLEDELLCDRLARAALSLLSSEKDYLLYLYWARLNGSDKQSSKKTNDFEKVTSAARYDAGIAFAQFLEKLQRDPDIMRTVLGGWDDNGEAVKHGQKMGILDID